MADTGKQVGDDLLMNIELKEPMTPTTGTPRSGDGSSSGRIHVDGSEVFTGTSALNMVSVSAELPGIVEVNPPVAVSPTAVNRRMKVKKLEYTWEPMSFTLRGQSYYWDRRLGNAGEILLCPAPSLGEAKMASIASSVKVIDMTIEIGELTDEYTTEVEEVLGDWSLVRQEMPRRGGVDYTWYILSNPNLAATFDKDVLTQMSPLFTSDAQASAFLRAFMRPAPQPVFTMTPLTANVVKPVEPSQVNTVKRPTIVFVEGAGAVSSTNSQRAAGAGGFTNGKRGRGRGSRGQSRRSTRF
jgi:hypothetical protein